MKTARYWWKPSDPDKNRQILMKSVRYWWKPSDTDENRQILMKSVRYWWKPSDTDKKRQILIKNVRYWQKPSDTDSVYKGQREGVSGARTKGSQRCHTQKFSATDISSLIRHLLAHLQHVLHVYTRITRIYTRAKQNLPCVWYMRTLLQKWLHTSGGQERCGWRPRTMGLTCLTCCRLSRFTSLEECTRPLQPVYPLQLQLQCRMHSTMSWVNSAVQSTTAQCSTVPGTTVYQVYKTAAYK